MQPVASPLTMTCATADPLTPALRALWLVRVRPFRCHSSRGPEFTAGILLWHAHTCQGDNKVVTTRLRELAPARPWSAPRTPLRALLDGPGLPGAGSQPWRGRSAPRQSLRRAGPTRRRCPRAPGSGPLTVFLLPSRQLRLWTLLFRGHI